jgi:predicted murein hydrolase (TIGR00659 family)
MMALFWLAATVGIYLASRRLYSRYKWLVLSPLLVSPVVLVLLLSWSGRPYAEYQAGAGTLSSLLGPATVAFAIPLHKHFDLLKKHALEIFASVGTGSLAALVTSVPLARLAHLSGDLTMSLAPRSVTMPFAVPLSGAIGGVPTLTAVFVMATGLFGIVAGPLVIRALSIKDPVAQGALLGVGAHGAGTAKAFEFGAVEGTVASLTMVLAGVITILITPVVLRLL